MGVGYTQGECGRMRGSSASKSASAASNAWSASMCARSAAQQSNQTLLHATVQPRRAATCIHANVPLGPCSHAGMQRAPYDADGTPTSVALRFRLALLSRVRYVGRHYEQRRTEDGQRVAVQWGCRSGSRSRRPQPAREPWHGTLCERSLATLGHRRGTSTSATLSMREHSRIARAVTRNSNEKFEADWL